MITHLHEIKINFYKSTSFITLCTNYTFLTIHNPWIPHYSLDIILLKAVFENYTKYTSKIPLLKFNNIWSIIKMKN